MYFAPLNTNSCKINLLMSTLAKDYEKRDEHIKGCEFKTFIRFTIFFVKTGMSSGLNLFSHPETLYV